MLMMIMYFHFRIQEVILFEGWIPKTLFSFIMSCIAVSAISFVYELLRFGHSRFLDSLENSYSDAEEGLLSGISARFIRHERVRHSILPTTFYFVELFISYSLMMITMTYNIPIFFSLVFGHILAYFLLTPLMGVRQEQSLGECCQ
ncbi:unnamed protein product [Auanema sp. JU1783]|nr:unnamed protein product [Auanema sp. JU1783]